MHKEVFNNGWRRLPGYLQGQQNQLAGALVKNRRAKNTQVNECPNRCLISSNHG